MVRFLKLIRWKNLLMMAFILWAQKYLVFHPYVQSLMFEVPSAFSAWEFLLLVLSVLCIAAGGYIINDYYDGISDAVNKPQKNMILDKDKKKILNLYMLLTILGIVMAVVLAVYIGNHQLAIPHILSAGLLYTYSVHMKRVVFLDNFLIAFLAALLPFTYFLFESFTYLSDNQELLAMYYPDVWAYGRSLMVLKSWTIFLAIFAFLYTMLREIVKDIEDVKGDTKMGRKNIPILIGERSASYVVIVLLVLINVFLAKQVPSLPFSSNVITFTLAITLMINVFLALWVIKDVLKKEFKAKFHSKLLKIAIFLCIAVPSVYIYFQY